jgi:PEP-CTERM putative exosortase interaction domain
MNPVSANSLQSSASPFRGLLVALLGLAALLASAPARADSDPVSLGYANGTSTSNGTGAGLRLDLSAIEEFQSASLWELTSFTWLSAVSSSIPVAQPTGRGYILIFDADLFSPAGLTYTAVNAMSDADGLITKSEIWNSDTKTYSFSEPVILDASKTYYILNSAAITTGTSTPAPYSFGFSNSVSLAGIQRWRGDASTWDESASAGSPNFAATFAPIPEPSSAASLFGLAGMACILVRRRR